MASVKELKQLLVDRGVDVKGLRKKAELEAALAAADGDSTPAAEVVASAPASSVDLIGEDGRRIVRGWAEPAARELAARITATSGEKLTLVESA